jgi:uncharacterized small protein (DUF1192 family)
MSSPFDDEGPRPPARHEIGQDLSLLSIEEIDRRLALLQDEMARLAAARAGKERSRAAADAFFKPSS